MTKNNKIVDIDNEVVRMTIAGLNEGYAYKNASNDLVNLIELLNKQNRILDIDGEICKFKEGVKDKFSFDEIKEAMISELIKNV